MRYFLFLALFIFGSVNSASAETLISELKIYNGVIVKFNDTADKCNLKDASIFEDRLTKGLTEMGLRQDPNSRLYVVLNIAANAFGILNAECATTATLNLQTTLHGSQVNTENPETRKILDQVGDFPISIYRSGMFGVQAQTQPSAGGESTSTRDAILLMTDKMLSKLAGHR